MLEVFHEIDGYKVRLQRSSNGEYPRYRAEARDDLWGKYHEAYGETTYDTLCKLAATSGIEQEELLITFGVKP